MSLTQDDEKAMEHLRRRLQQLSTSLGTLTNDLRMSEPLPTWTSLQKRADLLSRDMRLLQELLDNNRQFLRTVHAYPHASFPGATQEFLIQQLLRKKAEPWVEDWVDENTNLAKVRKFDPHHDTGLSKDEQQELWEFAGPAELDIVGPLAASGAMQYEYTLAEQEQGVQNVKTGLRRRLRKVPKPPREEESGTEDEDDEDGGDDGDEVMEDIVPAAKPVQDPMGELKGSDTSQYALPLDVVMRYMHAGIMPPGR